MSLANELQTDPEGLGYMLGDPAQIEQLINAKTRSVLGIVSTERFQAWCARTGMRAQIQDAATTAGDPLRSVALTLLDVLGGGAPGGVDLAYPGNQQMLGAWVTLGRLAQLQHDELVALATSLVSRAEEIGLPYVNDQMIREALA